MAVLGLPHNYSAAFQHENAAAAPGTMRPAEECRVFMRDHHVGYIHWATYEHAASEAAQ